MLMVQGFEDFFNYEVIKDTLIKDKKWNRKLREELDKLKSESMHSTYIKDYRVCLLTKVRGHSDTLYINVDNVLIVNGYLVVDGANLVDMIQDAILVE